MADFDWKKLVRTVAPAAATVFGTPAMGMAVSAISNAIFGTPDKSADEVATAIASGTLTGEQLIAVRAADAQLKIRLEELGFDLAKLESESEQAYLKDVQDARARQVASGDKMPQVIFYILLVVYVAEMSLLYFGRMPTDEFTRALITRGFGTVEGGMVGAIAYFIGSSRGSKQSGDAVRKIAEQAGR